MLGKKSFPVPSLIYLILLGLLPLGLGCKTAASPTAAESTEELSDAEILYRAILAEYEHRGWPVAIASPKRHLVVSQWESLNAEVRRRYIARVMAFNQGRGLALNVTAEYERRDRSTGQEVWVEADDPYTQRRARGDEKDIGEAIQARFRGRR